MSSVANITMTEVPVEILELTPRWSFAGLAANFARVQILVTLYNGDPNKWLDAIERGLEDESDVPFLGIMKQRLADDPSFLDDMRRIIAEFATRFGSMA